MYGSQRPLNDIDIDMREQHLRTILPEILPYITDPLARYNHDGKWDGEFITLNYRGQVIDLGGIDTLRISNKDRTAWIPYQATYFDTLDMMVEGVQVKVLHPRKLVEYKKELDGNHQLVDIAAAERYCIEHGL